MSHRPQSSPDTFIQSRTLAKGLFICAGLFCLTPVINSSVALLMGIGLAVTVGNPFPELTGKTADWLLKLSVVGLGFGMSVDQAIVASQKGFLLTVASITLTLLSGAWLAVRMGLGRTLGHLIASGTAICGGSAIAAVAPVIRARPAEISVALGVVFILNSLALLIFPVTGHWLQMTQQQFGLWAAIAIHDTSSVVGASTAYGREALEIATTVKLGRALWIIPLSLVSALIFKNDSRRLSLPWFIGVFILAMLANSFIPRVSLFSEEVVWLARRGLVITLFLIGSTMTLSLCRNVGSKPFVYGLLLWLMISVGSLFVILHNY